MSPNNCAWCRGHVPKKYRKNLRKGKAKKEAKTFYHYACAGWKVVMKEIDSNMKRSRK